MTEKMGTVHTALTCLSFAQPRPQGLSKVFSKVFSRVFSFQPFWWKLPEQAHDVTCQRDISNSCATFCTEGEMTLGSSVTIHCCVRLYVSLIDLSKEYKGQHALYRDVK